MLRKKWLWLGLSALCATGCLIRINLPVRFDKEGWQRERSPGLFSQRERMLSDVTGRVLHLRESRNDVEASLGRPDQEFTLRHSSGYEELAAIAQPDDPILQWTVRTGPFGQLHIWLYIAFNRQGQVQGWRVGQS
jgi:hypothetical protein